MKIPSLTSLASQLQWLALRSRGKEADMYQNPAAYESAVIGVEGRQEVAHAVRSIVERYFNRRRPRRARDLACGTGIVTHELANICDDVTGCDLSPHMLDYARATKNPHIQWREEDFHHLQGNDSSTDVITMIAASRYIHDPGAFHGGIHRLLPDDGIAVLSYADSPRSNIAALLQSERDAGLNIVSVQKYPPPAWMESMPVILRQGIWRLAQRFRDMSIRVLHKESQSQSSFQS